MNKDYEIVKFTKDEAGFYNNAMNLYRKIKIDWLVNNEFI